MNVEQIKRHHFFYGVDWDTIRRIDAPFVPHLRSITDTSYFPTDELDQVPDSNTGVDPDAANRDLAFLGYVSSYDHENLVAKQFALGIGILSNVFLSHS